MLPSLTLELKAQILCPANCPHCSHRVAYVNPNSPRWLDLPAALALVEEAAALGMSNLVAYPRQGDVSVESESYAMLFQRAKALGLKTKTTSAAIRPAGLRQLLPHLDQLTLSVDGLNQADFTRFRPGWLMPAVEENLAWLERECPKSCCLAMNVVVTKSFIHSGGVAALLEATAASKLFFKVNLIEILPGATSDFQEERLGQSELAQLLALKKRFKPILRVTVPAWEAGSAGKPSCPLGRDFLVIGPDGSIAPCVLLLHGGLVEGNIFTEPSLATAVGKVKQYADPHNRESLYTKPIASSPTSEVESCRPCRLFQEQRCAGGCVARARLFGADFERGRHCGGAQHFRCDPLPGIAT